jgi:hypothetical protein
MADLWDKDRIRATGFDRCPDLAWPDAGIDVWTAPLSAHGPLRRAVYQLKRVTEAFHGGGVVSAAQKPELPVLVVPYMQHGGGDPGGPGPAPALLTVLSATGFQRTKPRRARSW